MEVGRSGHVQGMGNKYGESVERGEQCTDLTFCYNSALSDKVLLFWGAFLNTLEWMVLGSIRMCAEFLCT